MAKKTPEDVVREFAPEWFETLQAASDEEVRQKVTEVAFAEATNQQMKEDDDDLANLKEQVKLASEQYVQGTKLNRAKIKAAKNLLEARGKEV